MYSHSVLTYMIDFCFENLELCQLYVDDAKNPAYSFLRFKHLVFCGGQASSQCVNFLSDIVIKDNQKKVSSYFFVVYPDDKWKKLLAAFFKEQGTIYERSIYSIVPEKINHQSKKENVIDIKPSLVNSVYNNMEMVINEITMTGTYGNINDFRLRGIGYALLMENEICGFCTSEYPSKRSIAIGIEVHSNYQRRGYAKEMTMCLLNEAASRHLTVYWECWKENIASSKTALSCGFNKVTDYELLVIKPS